MDYGPTIAAAFGSPNEREIFQLRTIFAEMLKRSPSYQNQKVAILQGKRKGGQQHHHEHPSPHSYSGAHGASHPYNYSSNASTGRLYEADSKSQKSFGVLSSGPVERASVYDASRESIAGYQPTSRNGFQY